MNESSLYFELSQTRNIFLNIADKSNQIKYRTLVISDGFAKSTNTDESFSITLAFIEQFFLYNNVNLVLTVNNIQVLPVEGLQKFTRCLMMKSENDHGKIVHRFKAEKIDLGNFREDLTKDTQLMNLPRDFKMDFAAIMPTLVRQNNPVKKRENLEDKYLEKIQEFLLAYSNITMKPISREERTIELLNLKRVYFKDIARK